MKSKLFSRLAMVVAALLMVTGCGSDNNTPNDLPDPTPEPQPSPQRVWTPSDSRPVWNVDWSSNVAKPQWTAPDPKNYENWMLFMVRVQDELLPYVSSDDIMSVAINGETRAVASPAHDQYDMEEPGKYYILKILGNEEADKSYHITLRYYNAKLKQLFEVAGEESFYPEVVFGVEEDFCIDFLDSCSKYPYKSCFTLILPEDITPAVGDMIAAFVGNECRGVLTIDSEITDMAVSLNVFGREANEQVKFTYYSQAKGTTTFDNNVSLTPADVITLK